MHVDMSKKTNFAIEKHIKEMYLWCYNGVPGLYKPTGKHEQAFMERIQKDDIQKKIYLK